VIIGCLFGKITLLVDLVLYGGEADMLKARLPYLNAEATIVVEGTHTFTGKPKALTFERVWDELTDYHDRLVYVPVKSPGLSDPWQNEAHQRNQAHGALSKLDMPGDTVVGMFDADEFPDPEYLRARPQPLGWNMTKYQMSLYWFQRKELNGVSASLGWLHKRDLDRVRRDRALYEVADLGLHFSSFGTFDEVMHKWTGFSHTELVRPDMPKWVAHCWHEGRAIDNGEWLTEEEPLNPSFPPYMLQLNGPVHWYRRRV
jgi:hypothetical protein